MIGVIVAGDHYLVRRNLKVFLESKAGITVVGEAVNQTQITRMVKDVVPTSWCLTG